MPICYNYFKTINDSYWLKHFCSVMIVVINVLIKNIIINIVKNMGANSESKRAKFITHFIFICQFFNTGCLILLANANFKNQLGLKYLDGMVTYGKKSDFDQEWFKNTGSTLVESMLINSVLPLILEGVFASLRWYSRYSDKHGLKGE